MKKLIAASLTVLFLSLGATGQTTFFIDQMAFEEAADNLVLDTFGNASDEGLFVSFGRGESTGVFTNSGGSNNRTQGSGRTGFGIGSVTEGAGNHTFTFDNAINAFGIIIGDLGDVGSSTLTATTSVGASVTVASNFSGPDSNTFFFGLTSVQEFTSVTFNNSRLGDFITFDNLQTGDIATAIPEPATWLMIIIGFAGVGLMVRRRQMLEA